MKKILVTLVSGAVLIGGIALFADGYEKEGYEKEESYYKNEKSEYKDYNKRYSVQKRYSKYEKLYINECGACHMAYQSEFLPKRSWKKMMNRLDDHFGVDATLDKEDYKKIYDYLEANAADSKRVYGEFAKFARSIRADQTPLKISETRYFKKEHRKLSKDMIYQKEVKSISNCNACHRQAQKGNYSERSLNIPNYGRWDD